jgi:signal transduction histidine kinase
MMKMKGEIKRHRIIIWYVLAIVLPCVVLGFLAFRGVKNDQALVEREKRSNLMEAGQQIIREIDAFLSTTENNFAEISWQSNAPAERIFYDSLFTRFVIQNQGIIGIFFVSADGNVSLLNDRLLYVPDNLVTGYDIGDSKVPQYITDKGWQMEFREKDYMKALRFYQQSLSDLDGTKSCGEILNAVARIQKKLNLDDEAIKTYDQIWNRYREVYIQNIIPLGAVALLENSRLYLHENDTIDALRSAHLLLYEIQKCTWELGYSNFLNFMSGINEVISRCSSCSGEEYALWQQKISTVRDSMVPIESRTKYLISFLENAEGRTLLVTPSSEGVILRKQIQINGTPYLVSLVPGSNNRQWGFIFDTDYLLNDVVYYLISGNSGKSIINWHISDLNGELLLESDYIPEEIQPVNIMLLPGLPLWSMALFPEYSGLFTSLIRPSTGIYIYIFIVIVLILAFGLAFTLQAVNNEMHLSKMKSYFMSTVSHEFKSPLTSIRQMAEMLVDKRVPSEERQQKYHTSILQQSERLSHLIDNILDFSKMEEGHKIFRFEKADIKPVVRDIVESFQSLTAGQGFDISLSIPGPVPDIVFDREAMEQVMHNLLDNACKYSGDSRKIEVHLLSKPNWIIISVKDYGAGIRKEDHERIFNRFYRAGEELTQTAKGSGIGLTIVKQIIEAHKGQVSVESSPGHGSTFSVRLPENQTKERK